MAGRVYVTKDNRIIITVPAKDNPCSTCVFAKYNSCIQARADLFGRGSMPYCFDGERFIEIKDGI